MDQPRFPGFEAQAPHVARRTNDRFFNKVFGWMFAGLSLTAIIAFVLNSTINIPMILDSEFGMGFFWGAVITEIVIVFALGFLINRIGPSTAAFLFFLYAAINGVTFSIFITFFGLGTTASAFFIAAGMFGLSTIFGMVTKRDLSKIGSIAIMALLGIFLASLVNIFFIQSGLFSLIVSYVVVILFCVVTAFEVKAYKQINESVYMDESARTKFAIFAAFNLYINFIAILKNLMYILGSDD